MKIRLTDKKPIKIRSYPKLMIDEEGSIYFMHSEVSGVIIYAAEGCSCASIGDHSDCWGGDSLEDYEGEITLSNDQ
jgi:hypothetical protein